MTAALRIVIAPDSFKGTIDAADAANAVADGWRSARAGDHLVLAPMADGGEGTVAVVSAASGIRASTVVVPGPDDAPTTARWLRLGGEGLVELAEASGLALLPRPAGWTAHTRGFGLVIAAALDAGVRSLSVAIGGSASTDGGAGMLEALGARLLDRDGEPIGPGARGLLDLHRVDLRGLRPLPPGGVRVLSDVRNPATGAAGAAVVFGPQKGLAPSDLPAVDAAIARFADLLGVDAATPGAGAAGATGLALLAWGGSFDSGADRVAELVGLPTAVLGADLVLTGEGRFDGQTAGGKVVDRVRALAGGIPVSLVAGAIEADTDGFADAVSLTALAGSPAAAMADPARWLREAGRALARRATH